MLMTQRYPMYFDGVVAGAPAMRTGHSNLATKSVTVALNSVGGLTEAERKGIVTTLTNVCDARDGIKDGMIFDVLGCSPSPA